MRMSKDEFMERFTADTKRKAEKPKMNWTKVKRKKGGRLWLITALARIVVQTLILTKNAIVKQINFI